MTKLQFNIKSVITILLLIATTKGIAQCGFGGTDSGITVSPSSTTQTTGNIGAGDYFLMNVLNGGTYTVSTCANGTFDTQLSLYNESGGAFIVYNDDFCGLRSTVSFTATFTGQVRVLLNRFNCSTTNGFGNADFGVEYFGTIDTDGDGIFDDSDLDDDNDGILDTDEQICNNVIIPSANAASSATSTLAHNLAASIGSDNNRAYIDATNEDFEVNFGQLVSAGTVISIEAQANSTVAQMVIEESLDGVTYSNSVTFNFASTNTDVLYNYTLNATARYIRVSGLNLPFSYVRQVRVDNVSFASFVRLDCVSQDTDGDGIPDARDLDSDNDGIYDVVESGALGVAGVNDADNDGVIDTGAGSFGANGLYSGIENNDTSGATITYTVSDSDGDGNFDAFELDSDNDGCNDTVEAGFTDGDSNGLLGSGTFGSGLTIDGNGVVTSGTDGYTTPDDNDSSGTYDFQQALDIVITGQPSDETICINGDGSISVTATGSDLSYQWQISTGGAFSNLSNAGVYSGVTTDELDITSATGTMDGYQYRVVISSSANVCSTVTSNAVTLTMQDEPEAGTNGALNLCAGETATLAQLNTAITGEDTGGTWSPALASGVTTYTYTVAATAPCTGNDTSTVTVTYQAQPDAGTNGTLTVCEGTTPTNAQLFAQLGGSPDAGGAWTNSGLVYTYTVTATAPCTGNDTATVTVTEQAEPDAGTNGTLTICEGTTPTNAQLFAQLGGSPDAGGAWTNSGLVYTYTVTATAPCTGNDTATVTVTEQVEPDAGTNGTLTLCAGETATLAQLNTAITGEDTGGTWSPALAPGVTSYTYTVNATAPCTGNDTSTVAVTITALEDASFSYDSGDYCTDESDPTPTITGVAGGTFSSAAGLVINASTGEIDVSASTVGTYTVTYTTAGTCAGSDTASVEIAEPLAVFCERYRVRNAANVWGPWINFTGGSCTIPLCDDGGTQDIQFDAGPTVATGWVWTDEDGNVDNEVDGRVVFLNIGTDDAGTYNGVYTSPAGCVSNISFDVVVTEQPDAGTNGTLTVCIGTTPTDAALFAELGGTPDVGGTWSNVGLVYTYTVTATAPCTGNDTATVTLTEQAEPDAGTNGTLTVCIGTTPTDAALFAELGGTPDVGGTWSNVGLVYTYTVTATAPCTGNDTATVTLTEQAEPDAGTNGTLTVCIGTTPTDAALFAELGGTPDVGGTWSNVGLVYTYTVTATAPCTGNDTATVTLTEQAEPDAGTNGTLTVCIGTTPTDAALFAELGGTPDVGGTWSNVGLVYTYTVTATAPCTGNDTATVTLTEQAEPDAGTNGTLTVCIGTTPTDAALFAELGGTPDVGGTWSNVGLVYTYTVTATAPCTGNDTATVTLTEQAEPDAGTNGTLTVCIGTTPTDAALFAELGGTPDVGGTWSNVGLVYTYTVTATAPCTGNDTATVTLTEQAEPDAGTNGTLTVCIGTTPTDAALFAELGGTPDVGGTWSNVGLVYTYTVTATAPCTGNDTATVTLTEQAEPDAGTNGTLTVCIGTTPTDAALFAELGGTPDVGGTWSNVGLVYTYTVTATAPCTGNDTATVTLTEQAEPDAGTNGTLTVCIGTTPTDAALFAELGGTPDVGGTWSNVGLVYTYTVTATAPCTGNDTATVTLTEQAEPDAGTNGTLTVCIGTTPTDAALFAELGGTPDVGGTWSNVGLVYTYTVTATAPCTGNDTATVTLTEQAEPDAGTNGTLTVCIGTTPTDAALFAELGGTPDVGGTWSNVGLVYTYTVTATAPCTGNDTATVTLTEQAEPDAGTNGTLTVCIGTTPTDAALFAELGGTPDVGGTWSNVGLVYTYTVTATAPCTGNDTATVTLTEQAEPDAGTNGTLTVCIGTTPTDAALFAELGGTPDVGGTWSNVGLVYTYTVTATAPCTGNDTATVTLTEQAEPDAGTNGTLTVCIGTTPTDAALFAELGGTPDVGGTWSNVGLVYTYTVTATAPCTGNDTATVTLTEQAEPDAGTNGTLTVCIGTTPTDAALFAELGGTPDVGGTWSNVGLVYTYTVTATAPCTGNDTATVTLTEQAEPDAGTNGTLTVCIGTTPTDAALFAELGGTPDVGGTWSNVGLVYTYTVTATAPCTGNDTATVTLTEQAEPDAGTNGTLTVCIGTTPTDAALFAELGGTPDVGGTWSNVGLVYTYTVTATAPCTGNDTATVTLTEQAEPDAGTNGTLTVCIGTTPTDAALFAELGGTPDVGGTWSNVGLVYTYTVTATAPCTGNDTATVTLTEQAEPDAGTNGTLTVCIGTTPTDAALFAELGGTPDVGGTWSNVGLVYTYTVTATAPCTGNDTATVTLTEQAEPDAGTNGTLTVCIGTTPTDAALFAELGGTPDVGGTWSNVGLVYTYTVTATAPCTGNDTATVTLTEQAEPDAGTNGTLTVCIGTTPTDAALFAELGGTPDVGGTWSNVGLVYTYTVTATAPCTGNDTATVTLTEQAEPDAGTNGTLTVCIGTTPTDAALFAELGGTPDVGGTWSNVGLVYTYTVTATAPCTGNDTATVTLTEQAEPDAGTNGTLTVCIGTTPTDAALFAELGGTPDVGGTWSNVGLVYTYTVTATAPCTGNDTATVTLTEQAEPDAGTNGTLTVCIGTTPTDAALFAELGGTPDVGGTWSNVGLVYTYTVTATAPCTGNDTATVTLTEQAEPDAGTNGTLTVCIGTTPTDAALFAELGGTPDVGGTWSNVGLVYTYTVTATAPCTGNDTATVTLTEQAEPDAGTNGTLTVCIGTTPTDAALFAELGGTPDVGGTWSNVGLVYTYTVTATAPCTGNDTATVTLTEQAEPDAGTNGTLTVCIGTTPTDAALFAELGGTPDVGGTWSNVGLVYTYTVTATAPCTGNDTATVTLTEQAEPDAGTNGTLTVCIGTTPTDAALFAELGGTPDVGGTWSNVGLVYTYTVTATAPCTGNDTATVTLTEQAEPDAGTNGTLTVCIGTTPTDAALFAELGGTPDVGGTWSNVGLVYTYTVTATAPCTGNDTATVTLTEQAEPDAGTNGTLTVCIGTTPTDAALFAELGGTPDVGGTWSNVGLVYTYTVTATAPCTGNDTATVTLTEQAEPDAGTNGTLTVCIGTTPTDAALFAELGGTPDVGGTWSNVGLVYTYTVTATAPCTGNDTATVTLTEQAEPDAGTNGTLTVCIGTTPTDAALFAELGGTPDVGGTWSNVGLVYTYTVTATAPCTGNDTATVTLTEQAEPDAGTNGTLTVCIGTTPTDAALFAELGGTPDVGGTWSNVGLVYTYTVTATAPCTGNDTATVTLTEQAEPDAGTNGTLTVCIGTTPTDAALFAELGGTPDVGGTWSNVGLVYTYTVTATAPCTGNDTATVTLTEQAEPDAGTNGTLTVCIGTTPTDAALFAELGGTPDVGGTWSNVGLVYTYTVTATAPCTGNDTATVTLTEQAEPDAGTNGTLTVCIGTTPTDAALFAELGGTPDVGGTWSNVGLVYTYTVAATAPCTGNDTATVTLTEQAEPDAGTTTDFDICAGDTVTLAQLNASLSGADAGGTWSPVLAGGGVYTYTVNAIAPCTGNDTVTVTVGEIAPTIAISNGPTCAVDLLSYQVEVTVSGGTVTSTAGTVTNTSGNVWTITAIAAGTDITLTVTDTCTNTLAITAPNCSCPVVTAPVSGGNEEYCAGSTIPTLTASVGAGETIDWYDAATGGTLVLANNTDYTPIAPGTYFAETRVLVSGCTSATRTSIILTENPLPLIPTSGGNQTECAANPIQTLTATATAPGGSSVVWYDNAIGGSIVANPILNAVGTVTYYAESVNNTTNCVSATRTAVSLTLQDCEADLSLRKTVDNSTPDVGDQITFTITLRNDGPSTATNIIVQDIIPADFTYTHPNFVTSQGAVTFNAGTGALRWDLGAFVLNVGSSLILTYTVTVDVCGEFKNQVEIIQSSQADSDSTPNNGR